MTDAGAGNLEIVNNVPDQQFRTKVAGGTAVIQYRLAPGRITFLHTEVPEAARGQHVADQLAHAALEFARDEALEVVPLCPFVSAYIRRHPEYQPLVRRS